MEAGEEDNMAVPPIILKTALTTSTDKRFWKIAGIITAAIFMPIILLILMVAALFSGVETVNNSLLDYSFKGETIPAEFTVEQRGAIEDMRSRLSELERFIAEKEKYEERSLDKNLIKAVFYCLNFGGKLNEKFDYETFCKCFEDAEYTELKSVLQAVSKEFPEYEITENLIYSIKKVYEYLNVEAV